MPLSVLGRTVRDSTRALVWWSFGIVGLVAMMVAVYPSVRSNDEMQKLVDDYPKALKAFIAFGGAVDYTSAAGYLGSELFSFMLPLLLLIAAIGAGARAVAGEEEAGTLELLLANPVSRSRVVLEKLGAQLAEITFLCFVLWAALALGTVLASMEIGVWNLAAATIDAGLLALLFGALALAVGAGTGRRGISIAVPAGAAVAAYIVNALAALVGALEPIQKASPFYHYAVADSLRHGLAPWHSAFLLVLGLACALAAPVAFSRRDL